ncbi:TIR domain-containing protein, partial [Acidobacteria bacterium ACD]|nr:TIR domain-containing protein [Acidobacteria bacterium ACD]
GRTSTLTSRASTGLERTRSASGTTEPEAETVAAMGPTSTVPVRSRPRAREGERSAVRASHPAAAAARAPATASARRRARSREVLSSRGRSIPAVPQPRCQGPGTRKPAEHGGFRREVVPAAGEGVRVRTVVSGNGQRAGFGGRGGCYCSGPGESPGFPGAWAPSRCGSSPASRTGGRPGGKDGRRAMSFENDVFVSYAHIDDQPLVEGQKGWVSSFHRVLEIRLGQLLGRQPRIWRDPKLQGNDIFADRLVERLPRVAIIASIVSPRYLKSEWCMRELREFWKASGQTGGMRIGNKTRVFKIVKTPVPLDQQSAEFQDVLGYEFYTVDPETGRARELSQTADPESQRLYWAKLDDLAHDMADLLEAIDKEAPDGLAAPAAPSAERPTVYLAETTYDLREQRDAIRRELLGFDATVLPDRPLPLIGPECEEMVREQLARCSLSIHLIGRNYGVVPEGETRSTAVLQNDLAIERSQKGGFGRLIWLPEELVSEDERQVRFIDGLQTDARIQAGADILQTSLADFKSAMHTRLLPPPPPKEEPAAAPAGAAPGEPGLKRIYLIFDQRDGDEPNVVTDYLFDQGFEVILPVFEGDEAQVRRDHEENLSICDGVLLWYGAGNELWLRAKLREVQKSAAFGRKKPITAKAVLVGPPDNPAKGRFRTHEALVISQRGTFDPAAMQPFLSQLQAG